MTYKLSLKPLAEKQFAKLSKTIQKRLFAAFLTLSDNPRPHGSLKLQGHPDCYRVRVGDYRIVYTIDDQQLKVLVLTLGHRQDIYDKF
ncbi:type II toxin-antitoxin system RelE family toxin [Methylobacter sp.]|uniref:type II toxin-antitoxin system RelE family toxin n=1 Tax=Methylobacter sp. TaxID=2051955 RepID=UPI002FDEC0FA